MNAIDPNALKPNPVTQADNALGTLPLEHQPRAIVAALFAAGLITEQQMRVAVFQVSGDRMR
jgi:hypothetical protein